MADGFVYINGEIKAYKDAFIHVSDEGFMFGTGVFETLRVYDKYPFMLHKHLERLIESAHKMSIKVSGNIEEIAGEVNKYIKAAGLENEVLKIIVSSCGKNKSNLVFTSRPVPYTPEHYQKGFSAKVSNIMRNPYSPLTYIKTLNYSESIMARNEVQKAGYREAVFLNTRGELCEGSISNIFFVRNEVLFTPDLSCGLLDGIVRKLIIEKLAHKIGSNVKEGVYTLEDLQRSDEAFFTNSVMEIMPLISVNDMGIGNSMPGIITGMLRKEYNLYSNEPNKYLYRTR